MARLRVRMELNRGGVGVPLEKLVHVVEEAHKFFKMLGEDVHLGKGQGEWLGFDFDNQSLNFTAEYVGPVDAAQVREFHAAFDGVTLLRRATIAQFARIADPIEEDELVGFGLFQSDQETEPSEWRSLSKREALRITEEIQLLLERTGDNGASRIPAALDPNGAASLFKERRDHNNGERRIEALFDRVDRLENEVSGHSETITNLQGATNNTEQNLQKLLVTVDAFCDRAAKQIERLPAIESADTPQSIWRIPTLVIVVAILVMIGFLLFRGAVAPTATATHEQPQSPAKQAAIKKEAAPAPPAPASTANAASEAPAPPVAQKLPAEPVRAPVEKARETQTPTAADQRVELKAIEPTWTAIYVDGQSTFAQLLEANETKVVESPGTIRVRLGNAGGVEISLNGKSIGPAGRVGEVRTIEFAKGHIVP